MSLDGTVIKNLVYEIKNEIVNGRIDKIYQKNNDLLSNMKAIEKEKNDQPETSPNQNVNMVGTHHWNQFRSSLGTG